MTTHFSRLIRILLVCLASFPAVAGAKLDLARTTPVPSDQSIPVQDFFRHGLLHSPRLNLSGTHLAARVTDEADQNSLVLLDLETKEYEQVGGGQDLDVSAHAWLDDTRLLFSLSSRKRYEMGLLAVDVGRVRRNHVLLQYVGARVVGVPETDPRKPLVWLRSDSFDSNRDRGVVRIDTNIAGGNFVDAFSAATDYGEMLDVRDNNDRHIVGRHPKPLGEWTMRYLADRQGELVFAITETEGVPSLYRLVEKRWEKCPVDLDTFSIVGSGQRPGELVVVTPGKDGSPHALAFMDAPPGRSARPCYTTTTMTLTAT